MEYEISNEGAENIEYIVPGGFTEIEVLESKPNSNISAGQSVRTEQFQYIEPFDAAPEPANMLPGKPCGCFEKNPPANLQTAPSDNHPTPENPASPPVARTHTQNAVPPSTAVSSKHSDNISTKPTALSPFPDTDDDFIADMQAIMTGKKRYNEATKKAESQSNKHGLTTAPTPPEEAPIVPLEARSEHAIFDKIAQSMRYANAYDLGAVELDKRFEAFDRATEIPKNRTNNPKGQTFHNEKPSTEDFLVDLDQVRKANLKTSNQTPRFEEAQEVFPLSLPVSPLVGTPWWNTNLSSKKFFADEPQNNIDQFTIPPSVNAETVYNNFATAHPTHAATIIGDRTKAVTAQYFVVHDRGDGVHSDAPASVDDINPSARGTHLYIGFQRVLRVNDWHQAGDGTKLERRSNTCFVHTELTQHRQGTNQVRENDTLIKASGTRFTLWQYDMLAYAYIVASLRRGRFLTVTLHREMDRALQDGHGDPRDFDVNYFYQRINELIGFGAASGFTYGIQNDRVMSLRQVNMAGYVNEFLPYAAGTTHAANQYGPPRRNPDGSWDQHAGPTSGPVCGNGDLFHQQS
ncbi:MAG: hypothetical protein IT270_05880 [Saprospiraceae bacterium]|nr:hypothetical protein [Saprospiraceae bacterium]